MNRTASPCPRAEWGCASPDQDKTVYHHNALGAATTPGTTTTCGWDTRNDPASVESPTRHRLAFVPLAGATVGPGYLKVAYDKRQVMDAPSIGLLLLIAVALGIIGVVVKGVFYLLVIAVVVFVADLVFGGVRLRPSGRTPGR